MTKGSYSQSASYILPISTQRFEIHFVGQEQETVLNKGTVVINEIRQLSKLSLNIELCLNVSLSLCFHTCLCKWTFWHSL